MLINDLYICCFLGKEEHEGEKNGGESEES